MEQTIHILAVAIFYDLVCFIETTLEKKANRNIMSRKSLLVTEISNTSSREETLFRLVDVVHWKSTHGVLLAVVLLNHVPQESFVLGSQ